MARKNSPTRGGDRKSPAKPGKVERRAMPDLYVALHALNSYGQLASYAKAHMQNKRGYLYLCWRDVQGVHSHYLGKAPKS